jgi:hypothetical protein
MGLAAQADTMTTAVASSARINADRSVMNVPSNNDVASGFSTTVALAVSRTATSA